MEKNLPADDSIADHSANQTGGGCLVVELVLTTRTMANAIIITPKEKRLPNATFSLRLILTFQMRLTGKKMTGSARQSLVH